MQDRGALAEALTARVQALPPLELSARVRVQNLLRFLDPLPPLVRWLLQALEQAWVVGDPCWKGRCLPTYWQPR